MRAASTNRTLAAAPELRRRLNRGRRASTKEKRRKKQTTSVCSFSLFQALQKTQEAMFSSSFSLRERRVRHLSRPAHAGRHESGTQQASDGAGFFFAKKALRRKNKTKRKKRALALSSPSSSQLSSDELAARHATLSRFPCVAGRRRKTYQAQQNETCSRRKVGEAKEGAGKEEKRMKSERGKKRKRNAKRRRRPRALGSTNHFFLSRCPLASLLSHKQPPLWVQEPRQSFVDTLSLDIRKRKERAKSNTASRECRFF